MRSAFYASAAVPFMSLTLTVCDPPGSSQKKLSEALDESA
jgi:hypothetical protein